MKVDIALKVEGKSRFVGGAFLLSWFLYLSLSVTGITQVRKVLWPAWMMPYHSQFTEC